MPSRLAGHNSAYLAQAADQPVNWYPWSDEAFARAREEQKPILLDIGAAWCHWCHVMDHETYEDPAIAELLNRDWICVKVDRDERPDVDARYQHAVQMISNQGGWPLTAFLTPEGEVFYGGTYFPPDDKYGRPGFGTLIRQLSDAFRNDTDRVAAQAAEITKQFSERLNETRGGVVSGQLLDDNLNAIAATFDFRYGGFGNQPKFPHPSVLEFVLSRWFDTGEAWQREIVDRTLIRMAYGGVYDQLGGGFHRYSVDADWRVPHFEKMSYDNAEMLSCYANAIASLPRHGADSLLSDYTRTANGIADWVLGDLTDQRGGFFASQDADVGPGDDGDFFTWTMEELRRYTTETEFEVLRLHFGVRETGDMQHDPKRNVLHVAKSMDQVAATLDMTVEEASRILNSGLASLREARTNRPQPFVDRTCYVGWNAMMVSAFLRAAPVLNRPDLEGVALAAMDRLIRQAQGTSEFSSLPHAIDSDVPAMLDDFVQLARACIDCYEATGEGEWLTRSDGIMTHVWHTHRHGSGALADTPGPAGPGLLREPVIPIQDSPTPSANGVASIVMARLAAHLGSDEWCARTRSLLESLAGVLPQLSIYGASLLSGIDWLLHPASHVVIVGEHGDEATDMLHLEARRNYRPRKVISILRPGTSTGALPPGLSDMIEAEWPRAYLCTAGACAPPATTAQELAHTMATFNVPDR